MYQFTIQPNEYLKKPITAFYHDDYHGGGDWQIDGTVENIICELKNDFGNNHVSRLETAAERLYEILLEDIPQIPQAVGTSNLTVCVVPRAKVNYQPNQLLFKAVVSAVIDELEGFADGTDYIIRTKDTVTTHLRKSGYGGDGPTPYPGITKDTCRISSAVRDKDILLIDDVYTKSINIVEDVIQTLLDEGARSVVFYCVGRTVYTGGW